MLDIGTWKYECAKSKGKLTGCANSEAKCVGRTVCMGVCMVGERAERQAGCSSTSRE